MAISSTIIAKAAEALNRHPDLSPAARRVGLELLNHIDRRTGLAWPSEARMAEALGYDARTIRRGKAELDAAGLVSWVQRGTSKRGRTPLYAIAWDLLLNLAAIIKTKVRAAWAKAKGKASPATMPPPVLKPRNNGHRSFVGRTFSAAYLSGCINTSSRGGWWKAPGTPQGQHLTDQQLDRRAASRIWEALQRLAPVQLAEFIARPDADAIQDQATRAERYRPGTGLAVLASLIGQGA